MVSLLCRFASPFSLITLTLILALYLAKNKIWIRFELKFEEQISQKVVTSG